MVEAQLFVSLVGRLIKGKKLLLNMVSNNENNVPPAQLQKTPLNRKGILAAVPIC